MQFYTRITCVDNPMTRTNKTPTNESKWTISNSVLTLIARDCANKTEKTIMLDFRVYCFPGSHTLWSEFCASGVVFVCVFVRLCRMKLSKKKQHKHTHAFLQIECHFGVAGMVTQIPKRAR